MYCHAVCDLADFPLSNVVTGLVVLGAVVAKVCGAWDPEVTELTLGIVATEPVELYIQWLRLARGDGLVCDTNGRGVVKLDGGP